MTPEALIVIAFYFLPTIVAAIRHHPNQNAIFILNLLLGWTILGWIAALVWGNTFVARHDRVSPAALKGGDPRWANLRSAAPTPMPRPPILNSPHSSFYVGVMVWIGVLFVVGLAIIK